MKIALLGDTAFFGKYCLNKNPELNAYLTSIKKVLEGFNYIVLNLETPFATNQKTYGYKSAYIRSAPENIEVLKFLGVNSVSLANNHIFDFGLSSFQFTKKLLNQHGIKYFGIEDRVDSFDFEGNKIAFSGFCCYSTNPQGISNKGVNRFEFNSVLKTLYYYHNLGYNNIMSVHAGQEHVNYPNYDHVQLARKISDKLPYVYFGHHPHVLQGLEFYKTSLHIYSLGNFCFDDVYTSKSSLPLVQMSDNNKRSAIVSLEYSENKLVECTLIPIFDAKISEDSERKQTFALIEEYNSYLQMSKEEYLSKRTNELNDYLKARKSLRNFNWYLKRLNYSSLIQLFKSKANAKKYYESVKQYL